MFKKIENSTFWVLQNNIKSSIKVGMIHLGSLSNSVGHSSRLRTLKRLIKIRLDLMRDNHATSFLKWFMFLESLEIMNTRCQNFNTSQH